jgi:G3E family GTPase
VTTSERAFPIPVTLLTGFLGSGKTTVLNHVLKAPGMAASAVVVNEFGAIGLDHLLVEPGREDIVLLNSGCLCCTVRGDIAETLGRLGRLVDSGRVPRFERVVIETTGLADPAPILHTLMTDSAIVGRYGIDGVVTTVDAASGAATLERQPEAVKQAAVADRLLLTKEDLAPPGAAASLAAHLVRLNPGAPIRRVAHGAIDPAALFGLGLFDPETKSPDVRRWLNEAGFEAHDHAQRPDGFSDVNRHDSRIASFCIVRERPLAWAALSAWLDALSVMRGEDLLRLKGIAALVESPDRPVVLHGVQHIFHPPVRLPRWPSADRRTRLVFITRDLDRAAIERTLSAFEEGVPSGDCPPLPD